MSEPKEYRSNPEELQRYRWPISGPDTHFRQIELASLEETFKADNISNPSALVAKIYDEGTVWLYRLLISDPTVFVLSKREMQRLIDAYAKLTGD